MIFKKLFFLILLTFPLVLLSQNKKLNEIDHLDVIHLHDGSIFKGKILEYTRGEELKIQILGGAVLTFKDSEIQKIVQENLEPSHQKVKREKEYLFRETGFYNVTFASVMGGSNGWDGSFIPGLGAYNVSGYQWNRWIGTGLGVGLESYYLGEGENIIPLFLEARGYLLKKNVVPYYSVSMGYGFAYKNEEKGIHEAKGGMLFHPALGVRFGASGEATFTLDVGIRFQKATFTRGWIEQPWIQEMKYHRITTRFGLLF